jgi:hypothetical protein
MGSVSKGPLLLAVTGGADPASFAVLGFALDDFCEKKPSATVPGVSGPPPTTCSCPDFGLPKFR